MIFASILAAMPLQAQVILTKLIPVGASDSERAGAGVQSVGIGAGRVVVGSPQARNAAGVATGGVYVWDLKTKAQLKTIFPPADSANAGMEFGTSVAVAGSLLAVGAPGADSSASGSENFGALYLFDLLTGKFLLRVVGSNVAGEAWGKTVGIDGENLGMTSTTANGGVGGFQLLRLNGEVLLSIGGGAPAMPVVPGDNFGATMAMKDGFVVIGAPNMADSANLNAGRVFVFTAEGEFLFSHSPGVANVQYGCCVAIGVSPVRFAAVGGKGGNGRVEGLRLPNPSDPLTVSYLFSTSSGAAGGKGGGIAVATDSGRLLTSQPGSGGDSGALLDVTENTLTLPTVTHTNFGAALAAADGVFAITAPDDSNLVSNAGAVYLMSDLSRPSWSSTICSDVFGSGAPASQTPLLAGEAIKGNNTPSFYSTFPTVLGHMAFIANMTGSGTTGGKTQSIGLRDPGSGSIQTVTLTTTSAGGIMPGSFTSPVMNAYDHFWTMAKLMPGRTPALMHIGTGGTQTVRRLGESLFSGTVSSVRSGRADDGLSGNGDYAYTFTLKSGTGSPRVTAANDSVMHFGTPALPSEVREGMATSMPGAHLYGQLPSRLSMNGGMVIHSVPITGGAPAATSADNAAVLISTGAVALRKGASAPDTNGVAVIGKFSSFLGEVTQSNTSSSPVWLVRASLALGSGVPKITAADNEGLWTNAGGTPHLVVQKGDATIYGTIKRFIHYGIVSGGDCLVLAQLSGSKVTAANDLILLLYPSSGGYRLLMREGDCLSTPDRARVGSILGIDMTCYADNAPVVDSTYGVLATLASTPGGATASNNLVWCTGDTATSLTSTTTRRPFIRLRKGVRSLSPAGRHQINSFRLSFGKDPSGACNTGLAHSVVAGRSGLTSLSVLYPDKTEAILLLSGKLP